MANLVRSALFSGLKTLRTSTALKQSGVRTFASEADPEDYGYCKWCTLPYLLISLTHCQFRSGSA